MPGLDLTWKLLSQIYIENCIHTFSAADIPLPQIDKVLLGKDKIEDVTIRRVGVG